MGRSAPGKWKGRVGRKQSEATMKEAIEQAQQRMQQKMLKSIAEKKAAQERAERTKKKKEKIDPYKAARALAGNKTGTIMKLYWAAWQVGVKQCQHARSLDNREKQWRCSCTRDRFSVGGCGACHVLKDPHYQLPFGAEAKHLPSLKQYSSSVMAASRLTADSSTWHSVGLDGTSWDQRATTAPSGMSLNRSMPSLASNYGYGGAEIPRQHLTPLLKGGKWEEAARWGSGRQCWYNKSTGQMTYTDPQLHETQQASQDPTGYLGSRHHLESEHLKAEHQADYLHAKQSGHFRNIDVVTSSNAVGKLDMGSTVLNHYPTHMRRR